MKVLAQFLSALFCGRQWMGPTCVNLSIFGSNMRWDQRSQLPEHNFSQYLIRSQNVAPLYTNIDIHENFHKILKSAHHVNARKVQKRQPASLSLQNQLSTLRRWWNVLRHQVQGWQAKRVAHIIFFIRFLLGKKKEFFPRNFWFLIIRVLLPPYGDLAWLVHLWRRNLGSWWPFFGYTAITLFLVRNNF